MDFDIMFNELLQLQTVVKRGIEMEHATNALIDLIKEHGRWVDPPVEEWKMEFNFEIGS